MVLSLMFFSYKWFAFYEDNSKNIIFLIYELLGIKKKC